MGMVAILFNDAEPLEQIISNPSTEGPMRTLVKIDLTFREENV